MGDGLQTHMWGDFMAKEPTKILVNQDSDRYIETEGTKDGAVTLSLTDEDMGRSVMFVLERSDADKLIDALSPKCPACDRPLVKFNDDYIPDGANGWVKNSPDQWVCSNPECEKFFF
jgi:uncharacterized protein with PIN domain